MDIQDSQQCLCTLFESVDAIGDKHGFLLKRISIDNVKPFDVEVL